MQTIRLRFDDQAAASQSLEDAGWLVDGQVPSVVLVDGARCDIDMIGALYEQTGIDDAGEPITSQLPGYHVNLLWWGEAKPPAIGGELVNPDHALRAWLI